MKDRATIGKREEERVAAAVASIPGIKGLYRNVYVPCAGGRTAEIDLLVLTHSSAIVIEVKTYTSGYITGSVQRFEWMHHYKPPGAKKQVTRFYSPLRQIRSQIEKLSDFLGVPVKHISGLVVFSDRATLRKVPSRVDNCAVTQTRYLPGIIRRHLSRKPCFSPAELRRLQQRIDAIPKASEGTKRAHRLQAKAAERARKNEQERRRASRKKK